MDVAIELEDNTERQRLHIETRDSEVDAEYNKDIADVAVKQQDMDTMNDQNDLDGTSVNETEQVDDNFIEDSKAGNSPEKKDAIPDGRMQNPTDQDLRLYVKSFLSNLGQGKKSQGNYDSLGDKSFYANLDDEELKNMNIHSISEGLIVQKSYQGSSGAWLKCDQCPFETYGRYKMKIHIERVHEKIKRYACEQCPNKYYCRDELKRHIENVHDEIKRHICQQCGYGTARKLALDRHMVSVHSIGDMTFKCEKCPFGSMAKSKMRQHISDVHDKIRDYVCEECGHAFSQKSSLKTHKQCVHTVGEKKFKCDQCPYKSHVKQLLNMHVKKKHLK